jgi:hypothetical protein
MRAKLASDAWIWQSGEPTLDAIPTTQFRDLRAIGGALRFDQGQWYYNQNIASWGTPRGWSHGTYGPKPYPPLHAPPAGGIIAYRKAIELPGGFGWGAIKWTTPGGELTLEHSVLMAPLWFLSLLFAIVPLIWWRGHRGKYNRQRRFAAGLCPSCGYDLRVTPDLCPECGMIPSKAN